MTRVAVPCFSGPFRLVEAEQAGLGFKGGRVVAGVWSGEEGLWPLVLLPCTVPAVTPARPQSAGTTPGLASPAGEDSRVAQALAPDALLRGDSVQRGLSCAWARCLLQLLLGRALEGA